MTGPSPRWRTAGPSSACWSAGPALSKMASGLRGSSPGRLRARRRRAKRAKSAAFTASLAWPAANCLMRPDPQVRTYRSPSTSTSSMSWAGPSSSSRPSGLNGARLVPSAPWTRSALARTMPSSRCCSLSKAALGLPRLRVSSSCLVTLRSAARLTLNFASADGFTGGTASAVARQRSLQVSSSRGRRARAARRWASAASSAPCTVAWARSSEAPRVSRCSSRTSSPRLQAASIRSGRPAASARRAAPSQPVTRASAGPRRRVRAAASRWCSASSRRPRSSAIRPASRCACTASLAPLASSRAAARFASVSSLAEAGPAWYRASASTRAA